MSRAGIPHSICMTRSTLLALASAATLLLPGAASAQAKHYLFESIGGLRLHNVTADPATLQGKKGLRVTISEEAMRQLQRMAPEERQQFQLDELASVEELDFSNRMA
jgi:hypothetical protein